MKRVTASDARKNWFRLLDEAAAGEVVVIERAGKRILLQREGADPSPEELPDYADLVRVPRGEHVERADRWTWEWSEASGELSPAGGDDE